MSKLDIIETIEHIKFELSALKEALIKDKAIVKKDKKAFKSVREYEFFGMWKDREDMKDLSTADWLIRLRKDQWSKR